MTQRINWHHTATKQVLLLLAGHLPVLAFAAYQFDSGMLLGLCIGLLILAGPAAAYASAPGSRFCGVMLGIGSMGMSGLLIHLGHGMIEMHFHIFAMLAVLIVLGDTWAILAAAATIAAHHMLFWVFLSSSVFNYNAGFGMVLLHAVFVVAETIPACYVAIQFGRSRDAEAVTLEQLPAAAREVARATAQVAELTSKIAAHAQEQRAMSQETLAATEEISAVARTNTGDAARSASLVEEIFGRQLGQAHGQAEEMMTAMTKIQHSSGRINSVLSVIDKISFQTNLLALNAAIEAARAGDAGLGFGVVADEVRALAHRCGEAAVETRKLTEEAARESQEGGNRMMSLRTVIGKIRAEADAFREAFEAIRRGSAEQSQTIEHITQNQQRLNLATEQIAEVAQESASSSDALAEQVRKLEDLVAMLC